MKLPAAPVLYSSNDQQTVRGILEREDEKNFKKGMDVRLQQGERFILKSPNGDLWSIEVDNSGNISAGAL